MIIQIILCIVGAYLISKAICWCAMHLAAFWAGVICAIRNIDCWDDLSEDQKTDEAKSIAKELAEKHMSYRLLLRIGSLDRQTSLLDKLKES